MEVPGSKDFEFTPSQDAESFRMSMVAALRREIDSLDAQKCAKEEELRRRPCLTRLVPAHESRCVLESMNQNVKVITHR